MICVGIDVSKEKSTVCVLKEGGELYIEPFEIDHTEKSLKELYTILEKDREKVKIVLEATGVYHLPIVTYFVTRNFFVSVINPLLLKKYISVSLRRAKTDKIDSVKIAGYGLDNWFRLKNYEIEDEVYSELKLLGRQYSHYMKLHITSKIELANVLDYSMPGIKSLFIVNNNKLADFALEYCHYDNIKKQTLEEFIVSYRTWAKKNKYLNNEKKAIKIYEVATNAISIISSQSKTTKLIVMEAARVLKEVDKTLEKILSRMQELAKKLKEYPIVIEMHGVGEKLAPRLIAEIGNIKRFHSGKALIAYAGIDPPVYQSGKFIGNKRSISKRGSPLLRRAGYEIMKCLKTKKPEDDPVYNFIIKKENEGKPKKVAKIAGLNKFLKIYFAKVKNVHEI